MVLIERDGADSPPSFYVVLTDHPTAAFPLPELADSRQSENHILDSLASWLSDGPSLSTERPAGRKREGTSFLWLDVPVHVALATAVSPRLQIPSTPLDLLHVPSHKCRLRLGSAPSAGVFSRWVDWWLGRLQPVPQVGGLQLEYVLSFLPAKYSCEASSYPCCWVARRALWALSGSGPFPGGIYTLCSHSRTEHGLVASLGVVPAGQGQRRLYFQYSLGSQSLHTKTPLSSFSW